MLSVVIDYKCKKLNLLYLQLMFVIEEKTYQWKILFDRFFYVQKWFWKSISEQTKLPRKFYESWLIIPHLILLFYDKKRRSEMRIINWIFWHTIFLFYSHHINHINWHFQLITIIDNKKTRHNKDIYLETKI